MMPVIETPVQRPAESVRSCETGRILVMDDEPLIAVLATDILAQLGYEIETVGDGRSRYRVKLWPVGEAEPEPWDLERYESGDLESGSALLLAHHADVTFGNVTVRPLRERGSR